MANKVRIVTMVVDTRNLTLYLEDGTTHLIPQGDPNLQRIITEATPGILRKEIVEVSLDDTPSVYSEFQEKSSGLVKFFRMTKKAVADFFAKKEAPHVQPTIIGNIHPVALPTSQLSREEPAAAPAATEAEAKMAAVVSEIIAHKAVPVTDHSFSDTQVTGSNSVNTVVAVVGGVVIPGVEQLRPQMVHANQNEGPGMANLLKRVAAVAEKRRHSVEDLLKFMKRGDLPVADDGSILIYKVLNKSGDEFVDCHTGKVPQKIGSYVCMDERMVDHDRTQECSNGLHVARRGYLSGFSGNAMVLAKVAPEDVIAVPRYDANKMRVCGYHILFELSAKDAGLLRSGRPMTENTEAAQMLAKAMRGDHVARLEEVRITENLGGGIEIKKLITEAGAELEKTKVQAGDAQATALEDQGDEMDINLLTAQPVLPTEVSKTVEKARKGDRAISVSGKVEQAPLGRRDQAQQLYWSATDSEALGFEQRDAANRLLAFKKAAKVSWDSLGISATQLDTIQKLAMAETNVTAQPVKVGKFKAEKKAPPVKAKPVSKKAPAKKKVKAVSVKNPKPVDKPVGKVGPSDKILALLPALRSNNAIESAKAAVDIAAIKKAAKKAYNLLGVNADDEELVKDGVFAQAQLLKSVAPK